jgi:tetratricopeptide (TPR) repeat protein
MWTKLILTTALLAFSVQAQSSFSMLMRNDMFAGLAGNADALQRGLAACDKVLAENPREPEALVWRGIGGLIGAQFEMKKGNAQQALQLSQQGVEMMDRAVGIAPRDFNVRIPRGAALREATKQMPPAIAKPLLETAKSDFQDLFDLQKNTLDTLGAHPLGELLQALGDINSRQGNVNEAAKYYGMIPSRLPNTEYAKRAATWLATKQPLPSDQSTCVGCHTGK